MSQFLQESQLAYVVARKVQVSHGLVIGLRVPLEEAGRSDLVEILDLLSLRLREISGACESTIRNRRSARALAVETAMGSIEALGGPKARHAAAVLVDNLHSGSHQAFREDLVPPVQNPSKNS